MTTRKEADQIIRDNRRFFDAVVLDLVAQVENGATLDTATIMQAMQARHARNRELVNAAATIPAIGQAIGLVVYEDIHADHERRQRDIRLKNLLHDIEHA